MLYSSSLFLSPTLPSPLSSSLHLSHFSLPPYPLISASSPGAIAGGVLVAFVAILACIGGAFYYSHEKMKNIDEMNKV
jgi:hypothetical protein